MTTIVSIRLTDRPDVELVAEVVGDPRPAASGGPIAVRRALRLHDDPGGLRAQRWFEASDPLQPVVLPPQRVGAIGIPRRDAITPFKQHWDQREPQFGPRPLRSAPLESIGDPAQPIAVLEPAFRPGNVTALELIVLVRIVRWLKPMASFEIGTFDGRTTLNIAANMPPDGGVVTLDLPRTQIDSTRFAVERDERNFIDKVGSGARFLSSPYASRIRQVYGDSASYDFSPFHRRFDFVFVDASHAKANVLSDARTAMSLLRTSVDGSSRGFVLFHDYGGWEGVTAALEELAAAGPPFSTLRAIAGTSFAFLDLVGT
ncbi:MAG: class I SAM-dependent methyltransferase [Alphaproteobacteria bacterium]|nr:class I SAM-dependent methyltransferase [Alphaproteobacteria bacterium]